MDAVSLKLARNYTNEKLNSLPSNRPTKTVSFDGGIYSVGNDVVNGQISACVIKGQTWTNKAGVGDTSPQTVENLDAAKTYLLINSAGANVEIDTVDTPTPVKLTGETSFDFVWASGKIALYELSAEEAALDVAVLGQKYHYVSGTKSTNSVRVKSVGKNLFDGNRQDFVNRKGYPNPRNVTFVDNTIYATDITSGGRFLCYNFPVKVGNSYVVSWGAAENVSVTAPYTYAFSDTKLDSWAGAEGALPKGTPITATGKWLQIIFQGVEGKVMSIADIQVEEGSVATEYEPYKESSVIINLPEPLRSVPSANDEVNVTTGVKTQRVSDDLVLNGSESWVLQSINEHGVANFQLNPTPIYLPNIKSGLGSVSLFPARFPEQTTFIADTTTEGFYLNSVPVFFIRIFANTLNTPDLVGFKSYLSQNPITLNYQLAEPIVTKLPAQAPLQVFENGTVYVEPLGDPAETTLPSVEMTIPTGNSNKFGVASHDYDGAAADWVLTNSESKCFLLAVSNAGGAANIIAPNRPGTMYAISNASGYAITIKKSGGTGVEVTNAKTVLVIHNGTDYTALTAEL